MKYFFYLWCLTQKLSLVQAHGIWVVYADRRDALWFKRYFAPNLFSIDARDLLRVSPVFDFINDEGVVHVLEQLEDTGRSHSDHPVRRLGAFTNRFTLEIAIPYLKGKGANAYLYADDFPIIRGLFLKNLLSFIHGDAESERRQGTWEALLNYQLKPELSV